jgi:hypothetical protein
MYVCNFSSVEFDYCACVTTCKFEMTPQATEYTSQVGVFRGKGMPAVKKTKGPLPVRGCFAPGCFAPGGFAPGGFAPGGFATGGYAPGGIGNS